MYPFVDIKFKSRQVTPYHKLDSCSLKGLLRACGGMVSVWELLHCKEVLVSLNLLSQIFSHWFFKNPSLLYNIF